MFTLSARARRVGYTAVRVMLVIMGIYTAMLVLPFGIEPPGRGPNGLMLREVFMLQLLLPHIVSGTTEAYRIRRAHEDSDTPGDER